MCIDLLSPGFSQPCKLTLRRCQMPGSGSSSRFLQQVNSHLAIINLPSISFRHTLLLAARTWGCGGNSDWEDWPAMGTRRGRSPELLLAAWTPTPWWSLPALAYPADPIEGPWLSCSRGFCLSSALKADGRAPGPIGGRHKG